MTQQWSYSLCATTSLLFFVGCAGLSASRRSGYGHTGGAYGSALPSSRRAVSPAMGVAGLFLAADDEDEEFVGLLTQPTDLPVERSGRFGVRVGLMLPVAVEEGSWDSGLRAGLYYRGGSKTVYEFGLDYASIESDDGLTSSALLFLRGDVLFGRWSEDDDKAGFYFLAGIQGISEQAELSGSGKTESRTGGGLNLGLGIGSPKGKWDVRAAYSIVLGSDNAKGDVIVATGFAF